MRPDSISSETLALYKSLTYLLTNIRNSDGITTNAFLSASAVQKFEHLATFSPRSTESMINYADDVLSMLPTRELLNESVDDECTINNRLLATDYLYSGIV